MSQVLPLQAYNAGNAQLMQNILGTALAQNPQAQVRVQIKTAPAPRNDSRGIAPEGEIIPGNIFGLPSQAAPIPVNPNLPQAILGNLDPYSQLPILPIVDEIIDAVVFQSNNNTEILNALVTKSLYLFEQRRGAKQTWEINGWIDWNRAPDARQDTEFLAKEVEIRYGQRIAEQSAALAFLNQAEGVGGGANWLDALLDEANKTALFLPQAIPPGMAERAPALYAALQALPPNATNADAILAMIHLAAQSRDIGLYNKLTGTSAVMALEYFTNLLNKKAPEIIKLLVTDQESSMKSWQAMNKQGNFSQPNYS